MKFRIGLSAAVLALTFVLAPAGFAATFSLTGDMAADFASLPTAEQAVQSISRNDQPLWGMGWEVVFNKIGFGGTYLVNLTKDAQNDWWMDWYGQALFISYHIFGGAAFLDPFIQTGVGCAGRTYIESATIGWTRYQSAISLTPYPIPDISIFPFLTAGLSLHLDAFTIGAKLTFVPFKSGIPLTDIPEYQLQNFQVVVFTGMTFGH
jgi:hypothetical protein